MYTTGKQTSSLSETKEITQELSASLSEAQQEYNLQFFLLPPPPLPCTESQVLLPVKVLH